MQVNLKKKMDEMQSKQMQPNAQKKTNEKSNNNDDEKSEKNMQRANDNAFSFSFLLYLLLGCLCSL